MILPDLKKANLENKRVLMRVDFNVEFANGVPKEKYKISSIKESLDFVLSKPGVKLGLLSHLGRPLENVSKSASFKNVCDEIGKVINRELVFVPDCVGKGVKRGLDRLKEGQVLMLENVRFYEEEEKSGENFAERLAGNFDVYINEAFGAAHRDHSSVTKIVKLLPPFAGLNLQKEVAVLSKLRESFKRPAAAVIGGAKIETKLPMIEFFSKNYDYVLAGGKLGTEAEENNIKFGNNVIMPEDYIGGGLDIGPKTIVKFIEYINKAETIVWNGPMGQFEKEPFAKGTEGVLGAIVANSSAYKVAGGGETIQAIEEAGLLDKFNFISTGGGAMLDFLVRGTLPALEVLKSEL